MMTREEHLADAKERALQALPDITEATALFIGELDRHPELSDHPVHTLIAMHIMADLLDERRCRDLIEGTR